VTVHKLLQIHALTSRRDLAAGETTDAVGLSGSDG